MKRYILMILFTFLSIALVLKQPVDGETADNLIIDNFDTKDVAKTYKPFSNEKVTTYEGYRVYFENAEVSLSREKTDDGKKALRIQFALPPHFSWGNWLSIRKEFKQLLNLKDYAGLEISLKVVKPSDARLRITLSDAVSYKSGEKYGSDEMWWFDCDAQVLRANPGWITIRAPFKSFYLSLGAGARHNDRIFDLSKIIAYEINLISRPNEHPEGIILVNSIRAY